eukprot:XP_011243117.1 PREDICTED: diacylglycerol kinase eta-like isoform X2 [Mus musculus]
MERLPSKTVLLFISRKKQRTSNLSMYTSRIRLNSFKHCVSVLRATIQGIREDAWACSQHHPQGLAGGAVPGAREFSTAAGPGEDSFESESEHEGPQKLIRKVSTSGQMGTKISLLTRL